MAKYDVPITITHPDISKLWHPTLNGELKPEKFTAGSERKVWWKCNNEHNRISIISLFIKSKIKCKECFLKENCLLKTHPELCKELVNVVDAEQNSFGSSKKVWWKCNNNHPNYFTRINVRTYNNSGCNLCGNEIIREKNKKYKDEIFIYYNQFLRVNKKRNLEIKLSFDEWKSLVIQNCYYCMNGLDSINNKNIPLSGIDRIDNDIGYIIDNCVPCCGKCNKMKHVLSQKEFYEQCKIIAHFLEKRIKQ